MMRRWFGLGLIALILIGGCAKHIAPLFHEQGQKTKVLKSPIKRVVIEGPFNVALHTGYRKNLIKMSGSRQGLQFVKVSQHKGVLKVQCLQKCLEQGEYNLNLHLRALHDFKYKGHGDIKGLAIHSSRLNLSIQNSGLTHLGGHLGLRNVEVSGGGFVALTGVHSRALRLTIKDESRVQIQGQVQIAALNMQDGSWLSLYWLKADRLELRMRGHSVLQLAGVVNVLDLELWDYTRFKGRYLRAKESFVKTHEHSQAEISTWGYQHTLAKDASDIYYFHIPRTKADFMSSNGAVLDFEDWMPGRRGNLYTPIQYD